MATETGGGQPAPKEISSVHAREQRVYSYMAKFNRVSKQDAQSELSQLLVKTKGFPKAEQEFIREVIDAVNPANNKLTINEVIVDEYTKALESQRNAEDALVALLYDVQFSGGMGGGTTELLKLLRILENTNMQRESKFVSESLMDNPKDQAILFLTQVYFYDAERVQGKRVIHTEAGENPSLDEGEIVKLARELNQYLPKEDQFIIQEKQKKAPISKKEPQMLDEHKETFTPILTSAEKKRAGELEIVLSHAQNNLHFSLDTPDVPITLDIASLPKGAIGELFGREGKENIALFSLLSLTSPGAGKTVVDWLMNEKRTTKRREKITELSALSSFLFHEVLSPETKGEFDRAFAEDVLKEDASMGMLHNAITAKLSEKTGRKSNQLNDVDKLVVTSCERLFLLRHAQIISGEINHEVRERRKALLGGTPIDAEGMANPKDIEEMIKKIQDAVEFPTDPAAPIMPYELNVHFGTGQIAPIAQILARHVNGEPVEGELFKKRSDALFEFVVSLGIEKWSHQARSLNHMREKMPQSEVEKVGHVLPYELTKITDEKGKERLEQTYYIHDNTPDPIDPKKGCLYIDSQTELSVPVTFISPKEEGENMHIEYVYGINAWVQGIETEKAHT